MKRGVIGAAGSVDRAGLLRRLGVAAAAASLTGSRAAEALAGGGAGGNFPSHPRWRFAFLSHLTTDPLFVALQYGAQDACALVGCAATWSGSAHGDLAELAKALDVAITAKAGGIAVSITDAKALDSPIGRAVQAGIPVVALNARNDGGRPLAYIGMEPHAAGSALAARIVRTVGKGDVAIFMGDREAVALRPLAEAVVAAVGRSGAPVSASIVSTGPDVYAQLDSVTQYASSHRKVRGMFALDAGSTEGLALALKRLAPKTASVRAGGYGVLPATLKLIDEGRLAFTVDEQPYLQGFAAAVQLFLARLSGGLVAPSDVRTGPIFVTKSNLKPYLTTRTRFEGSSSKQKYPIS